HGRPGVGPADAALRSRPLRRNPAISACHLVGDDLGIVVHGRASVFGPADPEGEMMRAHFTKHYGSDPYAWPGGNAAWVRIDPDIMTTFAMDTSKYPE